MLWIHVYVEFISLAIQDKTFVTTVRFKTQNYTE